MKRPSAAARPAGLHVLTVHQLGWPFGPLDEGDVEYDPGHLPSCTRKEKDLGDGFTAVSWDCDVAFRAAEIGLLYALDIPVTRTGEYLVKPWAAEYWTECGTEYDAGLTVIGFRPASHGHCLACHPEQAPAPLAVNGGEYARRRKARQRRGRR